MLRAIIRAIGGFFAGINARAQAVRRGAIVEQYIRAGAIFGEALSYIAMGECVGFARMKKRWADFERKYSALGYRTIAIDDFIEYGGYGKDIDHLVRVERGPGEEIVLHAEVFDQRYKNGFRAGAGFSLLDCGQQHCGYVVLPSTRDAERHVRPVSDGAKTPRDAS